MRLRTPGARLALCLVTALAAVGGAQALAGCAPARPVPVLLLHGDADRVVSPSLVRAARDWWAQHAACKSGPEKEHGCLRYRGCGAVVVDCEGAYGHQWPVDANDRIWRFFTDVTSR